MERSLIAFGFRDALDDFCKRLIERILRLLHGSVPRRLRILHACIILRLADFAFSELHVQLFNRSVICVLCRLFFQAELGDLEVDCAGDRLLVRLCAAAHDLKLGFAEALCFALKCGDSLLQRIYLCLDSGNRLICVFNALGALTSQTVDDYNRIRLDGLNLRLCCFVLCIQLRKTLRIVRRLWIQLCKRGVVPFFKRFQRV